MIGVYGVMAYNVRRQRREFGIRLALGAGESSVRNLVIGRGLVLAAVGVAIGAAGAWLLGGVVAALLNDVTPTDPASVCGHGGRGARGRDAGVVSARAQRRRASIRWSCCGIRRGAFFTVDGNLHEDREAPKIAKTPERFSSWSS